MISSKNGDPSEETGSPEEVGPDTSSCPTEAQIDPGSSRATSASQRLRSFDEATGRQRARERERHLARAESRDWTRADLYVDDRSR
jgi:hypothetical protein